VVNVLVSGLLIYDSGKTWLGVSLVKRLLSQGINVGVYKPVAGHNAWSQYLTVVESFRKGVLVGEDVIRYASILGDVNLSLINPIDMLLAPPDLLYYIDSDVYRYLDDLENQFKQIVLARITLCSKELTEHFIFRNNLANVSPLLKNEIERLSTRLNAIDSNIDYFLQKLRSRDIEDELLICLEKIGMKSDVVVIESFNNAIAPFRKILDNVDMIFIVAPTIVAVYRDIKDVLKIVDESIDRYGEKGFETTYLLSKLKPNATYYIKPRLNIDEYDESIDRLAKMISSNR